MDSTELVKHLIKNCFIALLIDNKGEKENNITHLNLKQSI